MDQERLRAIAQKNPIGQVVLQYLAGRQRNSSETTVDNLRNALHGSGHEISRGEIVRFFKELQDANCGSFVIGRKGRPSRFEWSLPLTDIAKAATSGTDLPSTEAALGGEDQSAAARPGTLEHNYILRHDFVVNLKLPSDISDFEANRLAEFIKTLPFTASL